MKERWKADTEKVNGHIGITIENDEGMQIATVYLHTYVAPNREGGEINQPENAIARERARLIAAAPELLEACKMLLADCEENVRAMGECDHNVGICFCGFRSNISSAKEIIAKAEVQP